MARQKVNDAEGEDFAAATNMDYAPSFSGRRSLAIAESGERMVTVSGPLGRKKSRPEDASTASGSGDRVLEKPTQGRRIGENIKAWRGGRRKTPINQGERLWIKRLRLNEDQHQAAKRLEMTRWQYQQLERSKRYGSYEMELTDFEWCRIMRRRAKMTQAALAKKLGTTKAWVLRMENGYENCTPLIWHWEEEQRKIKGKAKK